MTSPLTEWPHKRDCPCTRKSLKRNIKTLHLYFTWEDGKLSEKESIFIAWLNSIPAKPLAQSLIKAKVKLYLTPENKAHTKPWGSRSLTVPTKLTKELCQSESQISWHPGNYSLFQTLLIRDLSLTVLTLNLGTRKDLAPLRGAQTANP